MMNKRLIIAISVILILINGVMNDFVAYLGRDYICYEEHQSDVRIYHNEKPHFEIPSNITDYKNTIDWILVRQIPSEEKYQNKAFGSFILYPAGKDTVYYWIVDKKNHQAYGPLFYDDYLNKAKQLSIEDYPLWKSSGK